jgi:hypothetical protein
VTRGELLSAFSAVVLCVMMFASAWYGVDGIPSRARSPSAVVTSANAWDALSALRWLLLLTIAVALAAVAVHAGHPSREAVARIRLALLALGTLSAGALIVRVLIVLPSPNTVVDQKLGAVLGVVAGLGIAVGAYQAVGEQRAQRIALARGSKAAAGPTAPPDHAA